MSLPSRSRLLDAQRRADEAAGGGLDGVLALCDAAAPMAVGRGFAQAVGAVAQAADEAGVRAVLVGAVALGVYVRPRATEDVDVMVGTLGDARRLLAAVRRQGAVWADVSRADPARAVPRFIHARTGVAVDLLVAEHPFEREGIARALPERIGARRVYVLPAECLAAMKVAAAGDPQRDYDFGDAKRLLVRGAAEEAAVAAIVMRDLPSHAGTWRRIREAAHRARSAARKGRRTRSTR